LLKAREGEQEKCFLFSSSNVTKKELVHAASLAVDIGMIAEIQPGQTHVTR
jgi:hypothetical protein